MGCKELSLTGFIKEMQDVSTGPHPRKFCFILGAGASKAAGIKTGQELVDIWEKDLIERNPVEHQEWKKAQGITDTNRYSAYSKYYERRFSLEPRDGYNYLEKLMEHIRPSAGYVILSYLLTQTNHNVVITTNFDHLIENAVDYYWQTIPLVIGHEALSHYVSDQITRPTIIKIHRDLLLDPKSRVSEVESLHGNWVKALDQIFTNYHPIFIGYAGNDNSLMDYLIANSQKFVDGQWRFLYWMLYKTNQPDGKVKELLDKAIGYYISHDGFDETLFQIGASLGYQAPKREEFLQDAENRFQELSDSIDAFTEKAKRNPAATSEPGTSNSSLDENEKLAQALHAITSQTDQQHMFLNAIMLFNAHRYNEALAKMQELVQNSPNNARYRDNLSAILHYMKQHELALVEAQKAVELEPTSAKYHNSLGVTLHEMKRYDEALAEKQKAIELEPDNAMCHNSLGITLHEMKRYDEALAEKQKAIELEPDNAMYHHSLGVTLHEMKRYDEALAEKQKAIELEPDNAMYHNSLGVTLHEMKRYDEALAETQKAIELEPDNAMYHHSLGVTLHEMKRYDEALAEKQKAIELEPDNAMYHNSLGVTLHEMKRYDEALAETQKAIGLEPDNAMYHYSLGVTLHEMKRYDEALAEKQKAVELEPDNAKYHNSLGITLHDMKRYDEALAEKQKAVDLEPDNEKYQNSLNDTKRAIEGHTNPN